MNAADRNILRLAIETEGSVKSVRRWWYGERVSPFANYALEAAAAKLKIPCRRVKPRKLLGVGKRLRGTRGARK
jgi:hypothetical protein